MNGGNATADLHVGDARCADLVLGLLSDVERDRALAHVAECAVCERRLRSHASARERARADWRRHARLAPTAGHRRSHRAVRAVPFAIAAMGAIALALPQLLQRHPAESVRWLSPVGEEIRTRSDQTGDAHLSAGLDAYRRHDLATAERELDASRVEGAVDQLRRLHLAHVRLERGDASGSVHLLRGLDWSVIPEPWRREGALLLVRGLRGHGESASADSIERALRALEPGTPFLP